MKARALEDLPRTLNTGYLAEDANVYLTEDGFYQLKEDKTKGINPFEKVRLNAVLHRVQLHTAAMTALGTTRCGIFHAVLHTYRCDAFPAKYSPRSAGLLALWPGDIDCDTGFWSRATLLLSCLRGCDLSGQAGD